MSDAHPTPAVFPFAVGRIGVTVVSDGIFSLDGGAVFGRVPKVLWERYAVPDHLNQLPTAMNGILLETDGQLTLIETGIGPKLTDKQVRNSRLDRPRGDLLTNLAALGVRPEDVRIVVNTHLHWDHCGWNTRQNEHGDIVPTFPNARYVIQRGEWEAASQPNEITIATYLRENLRALEEYGVLDLHDGDTRLSSHVRTVLTPGHTAHHQSVWIESGETNALFTGDVALHHAQFERLPWVSGFDQLPEVSLATKRSLIEQAIKRRTMMIITHETFPGLGVLEAGERGAIFQAVGADA